MTPLAKAVTWGLGIALVTVLTLPDRKTTQVVGATGDLLDKLLGRVMGTRKG